MEATWRIRNPYSGQFIVGTDDKPRLYTEAAAKEACQLSAFQAVGPSSTQELEPMAKKKAKGTKKKPKPSMPKGSGMKKGKGC